MYQILFNIILLISTLSLTYSIDETLTKYKGGWPTNNNPPINSSNIIPDCPSEVGCSCTSNNDCLNNNCLRIPKGSYCFPKDGDYFPDFTGIDQFNEHVSIYDFSEQNKYILIEMSADWCSPCHMLSNWITYGDNEIKTQNWWRDDYDIIYELIHNNEIYFITVLYEDEFRKNATFDTVNEWYVNYPDEKIPILADFNKNLHSWIKPTGIPAITLIDENMKIVAYANRGLNIAFNKLLEIMKKKEKYAE